MLTLSIALFAQLSFSPLLFFCHLKCKTSQKIAIDRCYWNRKFPEIDVQWLWIPEWVRQRLFFKNLEDISPFRGPLISLFWTSGEVCPPQALFFNKSFKIAKSNRMKGTFEIWLKCFWVEIKYLLKISFSKSTYFAFQNRPSISTDAFCRLQHVVTGNWLSTGGKNIMTKLVRWQNLLLMNCTTDPIFNSYDFQWKKIQTKVVMIKRVWALCNGQQQNKLLWENFSSWHYYNFQFVKLFFVNRSSWKQYVLCTSIVACRLICQRRWTLLMHSQYKLLNKSHCRISTSWRVLYHAWKKWRKISGKKIISYLSTWVGGISK